MLFTGRNHIVRALEASADMFNGNPTTDIVDLANYNHVTFVVQKGAGAVGTATVKLYASDDTDGTTTRAAGFTYRANTSGDTWSAPAAADANGFTTTAGANQAYVIEVSADDILKAGRENATPFDGSCAYLELTEVADDPCVGGVADILSGGRHQDSSMPSGI